MIRTETELTTIDGKTRHYAITIKKAPLEVYNYWRQLSNLPNFFLNLEEVRMKSERQSHWVGRIKSGRKAEWSALITEDRKGELIAWTSLSDSEITTSGSVYFHKAPRNEGAIVQLAMDFSVPGGKVAEWTMLLSGESPDVLISTSLKRLKALLETGEIPTIAGQPTGRSEEEEQNEILREDSNRQGASLTSATAIAPENTRGLEL